MPRFLIGLAAFLILAPGCPFGQDDPPPSPPAECQRDRECADIVSPGSCETARCVQGQCRLDPFREGLPCDDGDVCSIGGRCNRGVCVGVQSSCDDGNMCTDDTCEADGSCVNTPLIGTLNCDDGSLCTYLDICLDGSCVGEPVQCPDDVCAVNDCDPASGTCYMVASLSGEPCDDGDMCTGDDVCRDDGTCAGTFPCDDGDACTADECKLPYGCIHTPIVGCCSGDEDCGLGEFCYEMQCWPPGTADDYVCPRPATWVASIEIAGADETEPCCFDLDGAGGVDNALGVILNGFMGLVAGGGSASERMDAAIDAGQLNLLLSYPPGSADELPDVSPLELASFLAADNGDPPEVKLAGGSQWTAPAYQFFPGTSSPDTSFAASAIVGGKVSATSGSMRLRLPGLVPVLGLLDEVRVTDAILEIDQVVASESSGLDVVGHGMVGGLVDAAEFFQRVNEAFAAECGCVGLSEPFMAWVEGPDQPDCPPPPDDAEALCEAADRPDCAALSQYCNMFFMFFEPDFDQDGDGFPDAFSLGFRFTGVGAEIVGVAP